MVEYKLVLKYECSDVHTSEDCLCDKMMMPCVMNLHYFDCTFVLLRIEDT